METSTITHENFPNIAKTLNNPIMPVIYDETIPWDEWIVLFEVTAKMNGWSNNLTKMADMLVYSLRGKVLTYCLSFDSSIRGNYASLKEKLNEILCPEDSLDEIFCQLKLEQRKRKQEESLVDLKMDVVKMISKMYPEMSSVEQEMHARHAFLKSISGTTYGEKCLESQPKTLQEALDKARFFEKREQILSFNNSKKQDKKQNCNQPENNENNKPSINSEFSTNDNLRKIGIFKFLNEVLFVLKKTNNIINELSDSLRPPLYWNHWSRLSRNWVKSRPNWTQPRPNFKKVYHKNNYIVRGQNSRNNSWHQFRPNWAQYRPNWVQPGPNYTQGQYHVNNYKKQGRNPRNNTWGHSSSNLIQPGPNYRQEQYQVNNFEGQRPNARGEMWDQSREHNRQEHQEVQEDETQNQESDQY